MSGCVTGRDIRGHRIPLEVADALGWGPTCVRLSGRGPNSSPKSRRHPRRRAGIRERVCTRCGRVTLTEHSWCDSCIQEWEERRRYPLFFATTSETEDPR
ncbi:MAG: hypothetical protein RMM10_12905 [Anaerolineae bacterium]|uniref:hypothetical protein n=1 Tax=Thermoflexus sp. TaxID=1969742 RepID=UPI0025D08E97|nr:hypothetical protein [Thermoflexus sp.]MCS7352382.1 hypothetical protein [Thermoflexus sp.]MDW8181848.1 hypothetical protein [Anaerolineae bacterium]